jgi:hypothetical protein
MHRNDLNFVSSFTIVVIVSLICFLHTRGCLVRGVGINAVASPYDRAADLLLVFTKLSPEFWRLPKLPADVLYGSSLLTA